MHTNRRFGLSLLIVSSLLIFFCELGQSPIAPSLKEDSFPDAIITDSNDPLTMKISATPSLLRASSDEFSSIEVVIIDSKGHPAVSRIVEFSAPTGVITPYDTTDQFGKAVALYQGEPQNGSVIITAKTGTQSCSAVLTLEGAAIIIRPQFSSAPVNSIVPVTIKLLDGKENPVPNQKVYIRGAQDTLKVTNGDGLLSTSASRSSSGTVTIFAQALGSSDSAYIYFGTSETLPDTNNIIRSLRLFSSHSQLRADNSAQAVISAVVISEDTHNPLIGDTVVFSATLGVIDKYGITDSSGRASVNLRSTPLNGNCLIRAFVKDNSSITDSTTILFSGVTLSLSADRSELHINDTVIIKALLRDGSGNPVSGDDVKFSIGSSAGAFSGGVKIAAITLNSSGEASIKVSSQTATSVLIRASCANTSDSITVKFSTNNLNVTVGRKTIQVGGNDSTLIIATYVNNSGNPIAGKPIEFASNAGSVTDNSVLTDNNGKASTWLKSGSFATVATVQARSPDGSSYGYVTFKASNPTSIQLSITPDNIGIKGGVATLIATVKDADNNVVSSAEVSFRILKGPGGGEYIDIPVIVTTYDGIARGYLFAGDIPGSYRGCEVEAVCGSVADTSKLTISGEPHTVTISRPEDDTIRVPKGGFMDETTFGFFIGAVVKDVNGNPVADGTPVNFSSVVSGMAVYAKQFVRWELTDGDIKPIMQNFINDIPFEDINNNFQYDPAIDLDLDNYPNVASRGDDRDGDGIVGYNRLTNGFFWDFNGNGICDTSSTTFYGEPYYEQSAKITLEGDTTYEIYADLNCNGRWDRYEWVGDARSTLPPAAFSMPLGFDFEFWRWEMRQIPGFYNQRFDFDNNDFALVIDRSASTVNGVAYTRLTYPRQLARRLYATINAEVKGIRDKDGERFILPIVRE